MKNEDLTPWIFQPVYNLAVSRNLWLILFINIVVFLNLGNHTSFFNSKNSKYVRIFSLALAVVESLAVL